MHIDDLAHSHVFGTADFRRDADPIEGLERLDLYSAGLDIGSATSHMTISRLVLKRRGTQLSNQFVVAEREILYSSPILLTPYRSDGRIDAQEVQRFFNAGYDESGMPASSVNTGVIIVTGEAANRPNAEELARTIASTSGSFMCVAAGPHYEALLAAHGSGAVERSKDGRRILNIDIGGGTTKLSIVCGGEVDRTAAFSVGARLVAFDGDRRITRVEPPGQWMLDALGISTAIGGIVTDSQLDAVASLMADLIFEVLNGDSSSDLLSRLWVTEPIEPDLMKGVEAFIFSGGVSEYVYGRDEKDFGDLGLRLGRVLHDRLASARVVTPVLPGKPGIRATVLGAGEHSIQASGVTSFLDVEALPVAGLKVVKATVGEAAGLAAALYSTSRRFEIDGLMPKLCYAVNIEADPDYALLRGVAAELMHVADAKEPLYVIVDVDAARALGRILRAELSWPSSLVIVDGITVGDLDYVDMGQPLGAVGTVPVTVKSLTFLTRDVDVVQVPRDSR